MERCAASPLRSATRLNGLSDLPTVAESVPGYEASSMYGSGRTRNTPAEIVDKLNKEVNAALADPKMTARVSPTLAARPSEARQPTSAS